MAWQSTLKVSVSGVRGIVGESLTMPLVSSFATAFGTYVGRGRVIVGRDTRPTGEMIEHAVIAGLLAVGCEPVLVDVAPTPSILLLVSELRAKGGVIVTASHNPNEWNALKFVGPEGLFLDATAANELLGLYNREAAHYVPEPEYRRESRLADPFAPHQRRILANVDAAAIQRGHFKVAVDCCNGAGAPYTPAFLRELGCEVVAIHTVPDGIFPRGAEPVPENLQDLGRAVREHGCVLGFAQDPDGDRLALVDGRGTPLGENLTLVLAVAHVLRRTPGPVVVNLGTSKAVEDVTRAAGGQLYYSKIGEINVTTEMRRRQAVIGGEANGGVIWPRVHPCRDSYAAMALILEMLAQRGEPLDRILEGVPRYATVNLKLPCSGEQAQLVVRALRERYAGERTISLDGLRIDWEDRWVLIRHSNTEPVLRITAEARTREAAERLGQEFLTESRRLAGGQAG